MIHIGIDEAGLGPAIGPLCIAATVFSAPEENLWGLCAPTLSSVPVKDGEGLWIGDSKIIHGRRGLAGLERPVFAGYAMAHPGAAFPERRSTLLNALAGARVLLAIPWYTEMDSMLPLEGEAEDYLATGQRAAESLASKGVVFRDICMQVIPAMELNSLLALGMNKSEAVQITLGMLIRSLLSHFPDEPIHLQIDRQGGRLHYAPFLTDVLEGAWVETIVESKDECRYLAKAQQRTIDIVFRPKADQHYLPVAYASLYAKYAREICMIDLNQYFTKRIPTLKPTAGYHGDAPRFLDSVHGVLQEEAIAKDVFWRER